MRKVQNTGFEFLGKKGGELTVGGVPASRYSITGSGGAKKLLPQLNKPILGFLKEGIRYAFSTTVKSGHDGEEDFLLGRRLTFLLLLQDYGKWIRRNKNSIKQLQEIWSNQIQNLRADSDFDQAHKDDLSALDTFAKCMGFLLQLI